MTKRTINEIWIKILKRFPIDKTLEYDKEYILEIKVGKVRRESSNNEDGSVDITEKVDLLGVKIKQ